MKQFPLRSDRASLAVTETGGHLSDVVFVLADGRQVSPMHTAPWANEELPEDTPPILRVLRGDFFCAPFAPLPPAPASSTILPGAARRPSICAPMRRSACPTCSVSPRLRKVSAPSADIVRVPGGVKLVDASGREVFAACDVSFVSGSSAD